MGKYFFLLLFILIAFGCKQTNKALVPQKDTWVWSKSDTLPLINTHLAALYNLRHSTDTSTLQKQYDLCYTLLDSLYDTNKSNLTLPTHYFEKFNIILDSCYNTHNATFWLMKKSKVLQYLIFINFEQKENEAIIKYYKQLTAPLLDSLLPKEKRIKRMFDVGVAYNMIGDNTQAKNIYQETVQLATQLNNENDLARSIVNLNVLTSDADTIIQQSKPLLTKPILPQLKASIALSLASAYQAKSDFETAFVYNTMASKLLYSLPINEVPDDINRRKMNVLQQAGSLYENNKNYYKVDEVYMQFLSLYNNTDIKIVAQREVAKGLLAIGDYVKANTKTTLQQNPVYYYNKALQTLVPQIDTTTTDWLPTTTQLWAENTFFEILDARSDYYLPDALAQNNTALLKIILAHYTLCFTVEKLLLNNFVYDNSKIDFLEQSKIRTKNALIICEALHQKDNNAEWITKAFQFVENNKATVLLQKVKQNKLLQSTLANDSLVKQLLTLQKQLVTFELDDEQQKQQKAVIEKEIIQLENNLQQKYPQLAQGFSFAQSYTPSSVQEYLHKNASLLEYFYIDSSLFIFNINKATVFFAKKIISPTIVTALVKAQEDGNYQTNEPQKYCSQSFALFESIIPNTLAANAKELLIVPDGLLNYINFEALITKQTNFYKPTAFLINNYAVAYSYSYTVLLQKNNLSTSNNAVGIFTPAASKALYNKEKLAYTKTEGEKVYSIMGGELYSDTKATLQQFLNKYNDYGIIHLATHSQPDSINGNSTIDFYDTSINANIFYQNTIKANLIFLSACETSQGKLTSTEGVLSLARSLYYAGANNVIAAQWKVNDAVGQQLVERFYKNVKKGNYVQALQKAKLDYLINAPLEKAAPYYWASFIHIGYYKPTPSIRWWVYAIVIMSTLLLFLFAKKMISSKK